MVKLNDFLKEFFPDKFLYRKHEINNESITLYFDLKNDNEYCPECGEKSNYFACYYSKKVQDLPILDRTTYVIIRYRKMRCDNSKCNTNHFRQNIDKYVEGKKRYSNRLIEKAKVVALTMACEAGSRLLKEAKINISGDKLLQLAHEHKNEIDKSQITRIGIDDFALKKNIDMELFL